MRTQSPPARRRIILRTSLIYGPQPPAPVGRPLFLQFVEEALREGRPTKFLTDEFRCVWGGGWPCWLALRPFALPPRARVACPPPLLPPQVPRLRV